MWKFDKEKWRGSYKALVVLDHLLTHGPERVHEEFQCDKEVIKEMTIFQHLDEERYLVASYSTIEFKFLLPIIYRS